MEEQITSIVIKRLESDGITPGPEGTVFVLRYDSQDAEDRQQFEWADLVRELTQQSLHHGLDDVLEAAHIEMLRPSS